MRRCDLHFFDFEGEIEQEVEDRSCNMSPLSLYVTIRAVSLLFILAIFQLLKKKKKKKEITWNIDVPLKLKII